MRKFSFYAGALWEISRFFFIYMLVSLMVNPPGNPATNLLLLWISGGQIIGAVLFFLAGYLPERTVQLRPVLLLYKLIGILPGIILILLGVLIPGRTNLGWKTPAAVVLIDTLFVVFLILFSRTEGRREERQMHVIPIASGKGGVGKSLIAANLSIALGQAGKSVTLCDLDLGGSNLHLILGVRPQKSGLGTFLNRSDLPFKSTIVETEYKNLSFIPGDAEIPGAANLSSSQKHRIIRNLLEVETDYLILDLGAGTNFNILDFFLMSGKGIVVTTPTPTATVNAYLFLKNIVFRIISSSFKKNSPAFRYMEGLRKDGSALQRIYIPNLLESIRSEDPESYDAYLSTIRNFQPRLILNMVEDPPDADKANKLRRSCQQYLGLDMEHLGIIYRDDLQDTALRSRLPILIYKPRSVLSQAVVRIADKILQLESETEEPLTLTEFDDSYQTAEMEASVDFEAKIDYVEELLQAGALSMGDLVETIKTQQIEISQLKKENQFLKSKLVKALSGS